MSARFSNDELVQLLLVIGQYMMVGRIMATAQLEVDAVLGDDVLDGVRGGRRPDAGSPAEGRGAAPHP